MIRYPAILLLAFLLSLKAFSQSPNIILILTDDQGWKGTSLAMDTALATSKSDYHVTPNLERLANAGMRFSRAYAPGPLCSPSRTAILTGQTTAKNDFTNTSVQISTDKYLLDVSSVRDIPDDDITFPELLKTLPGSYQTAHYGKWHIRNGGPDDNGFDDGDGDTDNSQGSHGSAVQVDPKEMFTTTQRAHNFIVSNAVAGNPFYVQVSHYAVHDQLEARAATLALYGDQSQRPRGTQHTDSLYAAMTEDLDTSVGMLLDVVDSLGIGNNTYIIYMSDNGGAASYAVNTPLKRGKIFLNEGGIRVPLVITGPNILANTQCNEPVMGFDLYPTFMEWATGSTSIVPAEVEGTSLVDLLENGGTGPLSRSVPIVFHSPHYGSNPNKVPRSAIMEGDYKLIVDYEAGIIELYDLSVDIGEDNDLSSLMPQKARELCIKLRDYLKSVDGDLPTLNPAFAGNDGTPPDVDQDGLSDEWEFRELLTVAYDASDDPDGDGIDNATEEANGTDPYGAGVGFGDSPFSQGVSVAISPVPFTTLLTIKIESPASISQFNIEMLDLLGREAGEWNFNNNSCIEIPLSHLPGGSWFVRIKDEKGNLIAIEKVVKR